MKNLSRYAACRYRSRCFSPLAFSQHNIQTHLNYCSHPSSLFNHQSLAFCTNTKTSSTQAKDADESTSATTTAESTDTSTTSTPETSSSDAKPTTTRPLIHIHDEERPQLSIQLPKRWPFTRLARTPTAPAEPLNMHEMTTFSGLPAANFMPTEADKAKAEARRLTEKKKTKEEKRREARIHFWKRYSLILLCTPLLLYIWDNRQAKQLAQKRASYVSSSTADDARSIRDLAKLNNAEIMDLYKWVLDEECDNDMEHGAMSVDKFGQLVVRAVDTFKQRKQINEDTSVPKTIRLSREYDEELTARDKKREI
eukprot:CAMPEP_0202710052 /NCGR_PEP_ID=MMETSP1385-20130828/22083_1 /ASSEMBLY_ACC=CAM_ASM_000861 /TAXON_ID=933848 /ORGANISM="Elphidium margaritaceum" /LENGTH=310 /DNA_ID=CAMNT_0049369465 /DNA_START=10 /DNA_END=939 /DNA_ORIENTATION=-